MQLQLIEITTIPTRYELQIENAKLEGTHEYLPLANVSHEPSSLRINTEDGLMRLDTYECRKSIGFSTITDKFKSWAEAGKRAISKKITEDVAFGKQMAATDQGLTIHDIMNQKLLDQTSLVTTFLPSSPPMMQYESGNVKLSYNPGSLSYDFGEIQSSMNYIPGSVRMKILERGHVDIQYVGSPNYVPPSSSPTYEEEGV